ncbi:probable dehydrogenase [Lecanosticta acicola]|uniref:Probable dehydrogenase n=1 Tax=Lecanosticta acicola TaxID=111012 RepID=A0AAI8YSE5_9PEZI|nr:probable dehydrogenase [Lecanosticta acicola]
MSKTILLTGASRGIGLSIAKFLLSQPANHNLVLIARTTQPLHDLESTYGKNRIAILTGDLSEFDLAQKAIDLAKDRFQRLDAVIVNHGVLDPVKRLSDCTAEEWRKSYDVNFFSAVALSRAALSLLRESNGTILFTSSGAAGNAYPTWGAYGSSKAALNHLAGTIANEEKDIVSIAIRPGVVDTEMQRDIREKHSGSMDPKDAAKFKELKETGGLLKPEQPGHVMAKLAVEEKNKLDGLSGKFLTWNAAELKAWQE